MVNVVSPRCTAEGCNLMASFCLPPSKAKLYCGQHSVRKGDGVHVGGKLRCIDEACSKQATFGYKGKPPIYCKTCIPGSLQGKLIDVCSIRCEHEGCDTQPSFGKPGYK
eukprot:20510-Heterococcus_DN1.PRE.1